MALWGANRLVFEPDHDPIPTLEDGGIDQSAVTRIKILEVVDYHDE
jgi:proteic killer suppression protein